MKAPIFNFFPRGLNLRNFRLDDPAKRCGHHLGRRQHHRNDRGQPLHRPGRPEGPTLHFQHRHDRQPQRLRDLLLHEGRDDDGGARQELELEQGKSRQKVVHFAPENFDSKT